MKITKSQLREIIKEEITEVMSSDDMAIDEQFSTSSADPYSDRDKDKEKQLDEEQLDEALPAVAAIAKHLPQIMQVVQHLPQIMELIKSFQGSGGAAAGGATPGATGTAE